MIILDCFKFKLSDKLAEIRMGKAPIVELRSRGHKEGVSGNCKATATGPLHLRADSSEGVRIRCEQRNQAADEDACILCSMYDLHQLACRDEWSTHDASQTRPSSPKFATYLQAFIIGLCVGAIMAWLYLQSKAAHAEREKLWSAYSN